jgi:hypothetical protein
VRTNGNQRRPLGLGLREQDRARVAVEKLRVRRGCDRLRLGERGLGLVLQELRRVRGGHSRVRGFRKIRNCQEENASVLVLEAQCLPDRDQTRGRAVDAAEDGSKSWASLACAFIRAA